MWADCNLNYTRLDATKLSADQFHDGLPGKASFDAFGKEVGGSLHFFMLFEAPINTARLEVATLLYVSFCGARVQFTKAHVSGSPSHGIALQKLTTGYK
jgi:hypothetical protein